jgi:acetyl esterase/lipase
VRRFLLPVLLASTWSCTAAASPETTFGSATSTSEVTVLSSTTEPLTTTTSTTPASTTTDSTSGGVPDGLVIENGSIDGLSVAIYRPDEISSLPAVVTFHGGGWYGGGPDSMNALAIYLATHGVVVFNSTYRTATGGFPESFDDVSCAIRYAESRATEFTSQDERVTIVGHSAGAHLAAVAALDDEAFGESCSVTIAGAVGQFVGLSGPYDPTQYAFLLAQFFGTRFENDPAPWEEGSPYSYLGQNPELEVLLAHGEADELVPTETSELFFEALDEAGYDVTLDLLAGVSHQGTRDPEVVGDLILEFLGG